MAVLAFGLNHTTVPLDLRGRFAFTLSQIAPVLLEHMVGCLAQRGGISPALLRSHSDSLTDNQAERYSCCVPNVLRAEQHAGDTRTRQSTSAAVLRLFLRKEKERAS